MGEDGKDVNGDIGCQKDYGVIVYVDSYNVKADVLYQEVGYEIQVIILHFGNDEGC